MFRTTDGGTSWHELSGLREHGSGPHWQPGAGGLCLHTILLDPSNAEADVHRHLRRRRVPHRRRRHDVEADQQGPASPRTSPTRTPRSATASIASRCTARGRTCCSCRSTGTSCAPTTPATCGPKVSGNLPTDFGFAIDVHAHEPETIYVVPIKSDSEHFPPDGKLRVYRSRTGGNEWEPLTKGLPQKDCYVNVLRDAMAVDTLDSCGIYFGTTGGQVYASPDGGDTGPRSSATCRRCCRWRCRRCRDRWRSASSCRTTCGRWRASRSRGRGRGRGRGHAAARSSTRSKRAYPACCAARSAIT